MMERLARKRRNRGTIIAMAAVRVLPTMIAIALVAGCTGGPQQHDPTPEETTVTPNSGENPAHGLAIRKSDVSGLPDTAFSSGAILFFADTSAAEVVAAAGYQPSDTDLLPHASFTLDAARVADLATAVAVIDATGRFPVEVPRGRYLVCLADVFAGHTAGPPYSVVGCAFVDIDIPDRHEQTLTVSFGEAGVEAALA